MFTLNKNKNKYKYKNKHKYFLPPYIPPKGEEKNNVIDFTLSNIEKEKVKYRDNVLLTKQEYETLLSKHGENKLNKMLDLLHFYKLSQGKTYKSDYGAINLWEIKKSIEEQAQDKGQKTPCIEVQRFNREELDSLME